MAAHSDTCSLLSEAHSGYPSGSGSRCYGHGGHLRPLCQSLFVARQKEEVRNQGSTQEFVPRFQRDFHFQGTPCLTCAFVNFVCHLSFVCLFFLLSFMSLAQLVLVFQVVDEVSLFIPLSSWGRRLAYVSTFPRHKSFLPWMTSVKVSLPQTICLCFLSL